MNEKEHVLVVHMRPGDEARVQEAEEVFDDPVRPSATAAFLHDERHHLLIASRVGRLASSLRRNCCTRTSPSPRCS